MRTPLVAGNWKMNGSQAMAEALARAIAADVTAGVDVLVCPPAAYLAQVGPSLAEYDIALGAQDCNEHDPGAYTGEHAAEMLADLGCSYVLIGHSERRQYFGDTDERVAAKAAKALEAGLSPVVCVGETLDQRRANETDAVVRRQLDVILNHDEIRPRARELVIAYEPVWAIGTGESASPEQAEAVHVTIRQQVAILSETVADCCRILYGGSVKPDNARALFEQPNIDGGLIGGASLKADAFLAICAAAVD